MASKKRREAERTSQPTAEDPVVDGKVPHLKVSLSGEFPRVVFLPGDPGRLALFQEESDQFQELSSNREFRIAGARVDGIPFAVCSTGIGGGSTEIAVVELVRLGATVLVRVGGCGALREDIPVGSLVVPFAAVRGGGASGYYAPPEYPAAAHPQVAAELLSGAQASGAEARLGIVATVDSYYAGQGRPVWSRTRGNVSLGQHDHLSRLSDLNVLAMEMETESVLTLASVLGVMGASILAVHGNRITNEWLTEYGPAQKLLIKSALAALPGLVRLAG